MKSEDKKLNEVSSIKEVLNIKYSLNKLKMIETRIENLKAFFFNYYENYFETEFEERNKIVKFGVELKEMCFNLQGFLNQINHHINYLKNENTEKNLNQQKFDFTSDENIIMMNEETLLKISEDLDYYEKETINIMDNSLISKKLVEEIKNNIESSKLKHNNLSGNISMGKINIIGEKLKSLKYLANELQKNFNIGKIRIVKKLILSNCELIEFNEELNPNENEVFNNKLLTKDKALQRITITTKYENNYLNTSTNIKQTSNNSNSEVIYNNEEKILINNFNSLSNNELDTSSISTSFLFLFRLKFKFSVLEEKSKIIKLIKKYDRFIKAISLDNSASISLENKLNHYELEIEFKIVVRKSSFTSSNSESNLESLISNPISNFSKNKKINHNDFLNNLTKIFKSKNNTENPNNNLLYEIESLKISILNLFVSELKKLYFIFNKNTYCESSLDIEIF